MGRLDYLHLQLFRARRLVADTGLHSMKWTRQQMIAMGEDREWQRFGRSETNRPQAIATPPFYAIQYFPLSRKSMGGVAVDLSCRVLDRRGQPIPNLYTVGELAGVGGINGRAALEGTMLGPGLLMGRIIAREAVAQQKSGGKLAAPGPHVRSGTPASRRHCPRNLPPRKPPIPSRFAPGAKCCGDW